MGHYFRSSEVMQNQVKVIIFGVLEQCTAHSTHESHKSHGLLGDHHHQDLTVLDHYKTRQCSTVIKQ